MTATPQDSNVQLSSLIMILTMHDGGKRMALDGDSVKVENSQYQGGQRLEVRR